MTILDTSMAARFGTRLGTADGDVAVYSSDYETIDPLEMSERSQFRHYVDGIFMGYKWQCVELARRWMYVNKGYIFDDIAMAYDIFGLLDVTVVKDGSRLPLHSFRNGSRRRPEPGSLLIWDEGGEFETTGHVAIVTEVGENFVRIIEQNVEHRVWADGETWSRELRAQVLPNGGFRIDCTYDDATILGWVMQTDDDTGAVTIEASNPELFRIKPKRVSNVKSGWLSSSDPIHAAFKEMMKGERLATRDEDRTRYFEISETAIRELKRATNELHAMFLHATDFVLARPHLLERFCLPEALLARVRKSWNDRRTHAITGRFDFAMTPEGVKVFEYNVDSASCHTECGRIQGLWSHAHGVTHGLDAGANLHAELVEAWRTSKPDDLVHIFMDDGDMEERYHALNMHAAIEETGLRCKIVNGLSSVRWAEDGCTPVDEEGEVIDWVWKTWAWETALDELRDDAVDEDAFLSSHAFSEARDHDPRLIDVLLRPGTTVFEPLWTLIPSNKAILPILWDLYPNHPYLLESHFELTDSLKAAGYVAKPIVGRCGHNVALIGAKGSVLEETGGKFDNRDTIYQALFKLPDIDGLRVQVCTFSVDGYYAGTCVRCDPSLVITSESDVLPLRIVPDAGFAES